MFEERPAELTTPRLRLWIAGPDDAGQMLRYHEENREHLERWSPPAPEGFYTLRYWRGRLARSSRAYQEDRAAHLAIAWRDQPTWIIGTCNFAEIIRGGFQACLLGYGLDARAQGNGVMTEALREAIALAYGPLELHRVMANYMPSNTRSGAVLQRLGFVIEGYARNYLYINGAWRDHVLAALTNPSPKPPSRPPG